MNGITKPKSEFCHIREVNIFYVKTINQFHRVRHWNAVDSNFPPFKSCCLAQYLEVLLQHKIVNAINRVLPLNSFRDFRKYNCVFVYESAKFIYMHIGTTTKIVFEERAEVFMDFVFCKT